MGAGSGDPRQADCLPESRCPDITCVRDDARAQVASYGPLIMDLWRII